MVNTTSTTNTKKYTLTSKLCYASGDIMGGGSYALLSLLFLSFLVTIEGMDPGLAGATVMLGRIVDAIIDPLLGVISDRTRSRFGRRRIFIGIGILPFIVTFIMLWYSFGIQSDIGKFIYYSAAYVLFCIALSFVAVPYNALLPDMVSGYENRAGYTTTRMLISNISATIAVTTPAFILGPEASRTTGSYLVMGIVFGLFFGLPLIITFFTTWEEPPADTEEKPPGLGETLMLFFDSFKNRSFRQYLGIFIFGQTANDLGTAVTAFWLSDVMRRGDFLMVVSGLTVIASISMLPINNRLAKNSGKHHPIYYALPLRVIGLAIAFFMGPAHGIPLLILVCLLNGVGMGAASFVPWTLLPDLPDTDELITGRRNAGIYGGITTFTRQFVSGLSIFLAGLMLRAFGYVESVAGQTIVQSERALLGVRIAFAIIPLVLVLLTIWFAVRFVLTKKGHAAVRRAIDHKHSLGAPIEDPEVISACEKISGIPFSQMWAGKK
ncbi:MAG: MFS transporter [Treponema sp.]|nr:MFS transporter [Treponema sp.]